MRLRTLPKLLTFGNWERDEIVLGTDTRLNAETHRAQLLFDPTAGVPIGSGAYPTTADLFVKTRQTTPLALRRWIGFEVVAIIPLDPDHIPTDAQPTLPSATLGFRLDNGTDEYYWDGGAWSVGGASDWNTEQEVVDNIAAYDVATLGQSLRVVVNMQTTNSDTTPEVIEIRLVYEAVIDSFQEDIIYRSLIPALRASTRVIARAVVVMPATGTTLNLTDLQAVLETGYNVVDIDAVFDFDAGDQPQMLRGFVSTETDLLLSFAGGVITLTGSVTAGVRLYIRFVIEPEVSVWTSQDFNEADRLPGLRLTDIELVDSKDGLPSGAFAVTDKAAATALVVPPPKEGNLQFTLLGETDKGVDHQRLLEEVNSFFANNPILISTAIDEGYRLHLVDEYRMVGEPGQNEVHRGEAVFQIMGFRQWLKDAFTDNILTSAPTTAGTNSNLIL